MEKESDDLIFDDDFLYEKKQKKDSHSKQKYKARRKLDAYLERKSLKELLDDIEGFDWED